MALSHTITKSIDLVGDISIPCYIKVEGFNGTKNEILFHVVFRKNAADGEFVKHTHYQMVPDLDSPDNFIKQAYGHLKTLPEFAGAADV